MDPVMLLTLAGLAVSAAGRLALLFALMKGK